MTKDVSEIMYKHFFKRLFDFCIALLALVFIGWFLIIIAIWLHFANKGAGAFFFQERPGLHGKIFRVIKFKTMTDGCDTSGKLLPDEQRLTRVGKFVRSTSLDEIPQLLNVIKGDMSLIGPRPLLLQYLPLYNEEQKRRHEVRPGITGWAQVNGRNLLQLSKRFDYDVWYVDNLSFSLDFRIFIMTIKKVFQKQDIGNGADSMKEVDDLNFLERLSNSNL